MIVGELVVAKWCVPGVAPDHGRREMMGLFMGQDIEFDDWHWKIFAGLNIKKLSKRYWTVEKFR
jgi:hypothetical protein